MLLKKIAVPIDMDSTGLTIEQEVDSGVESTNSADAVVYLRISVPELNAQKCLQFHQDDTVWVAKQQILSSIAKTLKDGFNYGLFCPSMQGRAGKFLDEERPLKDYPLPGPIGYLEFKFKRRIYRQIQTNPRKLKQINTKTNLKQLMEAVKKNDINKVSKFTNGGLDPNFNDRDTGETPLTLATMTAHPVEMIMALVSGGAHLDFRNRKSLTPVHSAAQKGNDEALRVLLDLGAAANYRDCRGLTPLYQAVCNNASARCVEILLYDHAVLGITDEYHWTELHQASKSGNVQHLEQLIYYGADMNCQNSTGNTPLHVCAVNQKEECARILLFRGASKDIQNYANQNAFELAIISGNTQLANVIKEFSPKDVVPYKEFPTFSEKRRSCIPASTFSTLQRCRSNPQLHRLFENLPSHGSQRLFTDDSLCALTAKKDRMANRRRTELAFLSEFMADGPFGSGSPRSLSISSAGSGQTGEVDLVPSPLLSSLPKPKASEESQLERTVTLEEGEHGFGFILRGARAPESGVVHLDFVPTLTLPALQYFEQVDANSPAAVAGIKQGDFLLSVNGCDVRAASHDHTVKLIKNSDSILTLTVLTRKRTTSFSSLAGVAHNSQTALDPVGMSRKVSFSSLKRSGLAELENLDRFLMEYESSDRSSVCGESYNGSLASADSTADPDCKIASIRSVHGKRLTPAISQLEQWAEHNVVDLGGIWKARSAHCLTSSSGCASAGDEPETSRAKNQRGGFGNSNLSLDRQNDVAPPPGTRFRVWPESGSDVSGNPPRSTIQEAIQCHSFITAAAASKHLPLTSPLPPPAVKVLDTPVTVEACVDSSDANLYKIKHSLSIVAEGVSTASEPLAKPEHQTRSSSLASAEVKQPHDIDTSCSNQMTKAEGKFKVPPPPPPPPLVKPLKLVPKAAADRAGAGARGGKVRPAVPRRRSQLTDASVDQKTFNDTTAEFSLSKRTSTSKSSSVVDGGDASNSQDFLTLAEAARLRFLDRKSSEFRGSAQGSASASSATNWNSSDQESHLKPVLVELGSVLSYAAMLGKVTKLEKFNRESNSNEDLCWQEDLRSSLGVHCQLHNQHQVIPDNLLLPKASSLQGFVTQQKCLYENRNDKTLTDRSSPDLNNTTGHLNTVSTDEGKLSTSELLKREAHGNKEITVPGDFSSLIPPPPLFIVSGDNSNKEVIGEVTPVSFDTFDLASLAPPPPPGFEDPPLVTDPASSETTKWSVDCPPRSDSTAVVVGHSLESWSSDEVSAWLESIGMGEHALNFKQNQVDGHRLALLGRNELISLGVAQVGQRMKIERAVKKATMLHR